MRDSGFETLLDEGWFTSHMDLEDARWVSGECESCDNEPGCDCDNPCYTPDCD